MKQLCGTLPMWMAKLEEHHGGMREACRALGIDPGYWSRLRSGSKTNPSEETLNKLGLQVAAVLYESK